jgi:hypothetical protein
VSGVEGKYARDDRARPGAPRHPREREKYEHRRRGVEDDVCDVARVGVNAEEPAVEHE